MYLVLSNKVLVYYRLCTPRTKVNICFGLFFFGSLSMKMDLNIILMSAEELFFKYCRKSVIDCFQVVDMETIT